MIEYDDCNTNFDVLSTVERLVNPRSAPAFGILLDPRHFGYCVTVMARKPSELRLFLHADEELNALLGAVNTEMALVIAPLLLGRGQCHDPILQVTL